MTTIRIVLYNLKFKKIQVKGFRLNCLAFLVFFVSEKLPKWSLFLKNVLIILANSREILLGKVIEVRKGKIKKQQKCSYTDFFFFSYISCFLFLSVVSHNLIKKLN